MSIWIPVDVTVPGDDKSIALGVKLGDDDAWRYVLRLWFSAAELHPTGKIEGPHAADIVARRAGWTRDPEQFIRAMVEARWLDETPEGFYIHDWHKHTGKHLQQLAKGRRRVAEWRKGRTVQPANANGTSTVRVQKANGTRVRGKREESNNNVPAPDPAEAKWPNVAAVLAALFERGFECFWPRDEVTAQKLEQAIGTVGIPEAVARVMVGVEDARSRKVEPPAYLGWHLDAIRAPAPNRKVGDLGVSLDPQWWRRLTREEHEAFKAERRALAPEMDEAPLSAVGPDRELVPLIDRYRAIAEGRNA